MEAWEMQRKAKTSLAEKMAIYHGENKGEVKPLFMYDTYEEAKADGSVIGMIHHKMSAYRDKNRSVISLSNEYSSTLNISEIQKRLKDATALEAKAKALVERLYNQELDRVTKEYQRTIGGLQDEALARARALDYMESWVVTDEAFKEAQETYKEMRKEATALSNAKEMYIEANRDLIETERERARREELANSGILEELGITSSEG